MPEVIVYHHLYNKKSGTITPVIEPVVRIDAATFELQAQVVPIVPRTSKVFFGISKILALAGIVLILVAFAPPAFAWSKDLIDSNIAGYKLSKTEIILSSAPHSKQAYLPPFDPLLPQENRLIIPSIGVTTGLQEATLDNYEAALRKGVWRVSDFGSPADRERPTILAAHRFGYLAWTDKYRRENSFFKLPKLKLGDIIEIDYQQRKYLYEIYAEGKGPEILDYSADLILYTCEGLTGDTRIFKYAKLIIL